MPIRDGCLVLLNTENVTNEFDAHKELLYTSVGGNYGVVHQFVNCISSYVLISREFMGATPRSIRYTGAELHVHVSELEKNIVLVTDNKSLSLRGIYNLLLHRIGLLTVFEQEHGLRNLRNVLAQLLCACYGSHAEFYCNITRFSASLLPVVYKYKLEMNLRDIVLVNLSKRTLLCSSTPNSSLVSCYLCFNGLEITDEMSKVRELEPVFDDPFEKRKGELVEDFDLARLERNQYYAVSADRRVAPLFIEEAPLGEDEQVLFIADSPPKLDPDLLKSFMNEVVECDVEEPSITEDTTIIDYNTEVVRWGTKHVPQNIITAVSCFQWSTAKSIQTIGLYINKYNTQLEVTQRGK